jgi:hypothetical protein
MQQKKPGKSGADHRDINMLRSAMRHLLIARCAHRGCDQFV